ncbi:MAG: LPXTG cell wall anchor domain-containing protein, partial [Lachnospiraceae bacterium]|nr:LPXTG cell wall anchor domain-containing protein [Lachnospiraceae bacterium]
PVVPTTTPVPVVPTATPVPVSPTAAPVSGTPTAIPETATPTAAPAAAQGQNTSPKTGETDSDVMGWMMVLFVSGISLIGGLQFIERKKRNNKQ